MADTDHRLQFLTDEVTALRHDVGVLRATLVALIASLDAHDQDLATSIDGRRLMEESLRLRGL